MTEAISLGNVLTIIIFVVGLATHLIIITASITKWKTETSVRLDVFEKTCTNIMSACNSCYLKKKHEEVSNMVNLLKERQDKRIAELPLQLEFIRNELSTLRKLLEEKRELFRKDNHIND